MGLDEEVEEIEEGEEPDYVEAEEENDADLEEEYEDDELGEDAEEEDLEEEYVDEDEENVDEDEDAEEDNEYDLGITKEGVKETTEDLNAIYKDGVAVAKELKDAFDDIKSALNFKDLFK